MKFEFYILQNIYASIFENNNVETKEQRNKKI